MRYEGGLGKSPGEKQLLRDVQIKMNHDGSREGAARERGKTSMRVGELMKKRRQNRNGQ